MIPTEGIMTKPFQPLTFVLNDFVSYNGRFVIKDTTAHLFALIEWKSIKFKLQRIFVQPRLTYL